MDEEPDYINLSDEAYHQCPLPFRALARGYLEHGRFEFPDASPRATVALVDAFIQVIQNDLASLVTNHHESTYLTCYELVKWFQRHVPKYAWGSPGRVGLWISFVQARKRRDERDLVRRITSNLPFES